MWAGWRTVLYLGINDWRRRSTLRSMSRVECHIFTAWWMLYDVDCLPQRCSFSNRKKQVWKESDQGCRMGVEHFPSSFFKSFSVMSCLWQDIVMQQQYSLSWHLKPLSCYSSHQFIEHSQKKNNVSCPKTQ